MSINYELYKQLKEVGFPQKNERGISPTIYSDGEIYFVGVADGYDNTIGCYLPTLSELVESCGEKFNFVERMTGQPTNWTCIGDLNIRTFGSSPEEAVAKLWLELNKK